MITRLLRFRKVSFLNDSPIFTRNLTTKAQEIVKYTNTINLPKTKFPTRLNADQRKDVEKHIRKKCLSSLYKWQQIILQDPEFVLHDGPPYANGDLHMGHAVNKILKDIIIKDKIIHQKKVHYVPGWDCHGLPIELKALSNHKNHTPLQIREKARKYAMETVEKQKKSFEAWGVTGSWDSTEHTYRTFDKDYIKNQNQLFYEMYSKGLIYRDLKPVFWSPSSGSALAEAELEYDDNFISNSLYFRCKLKNPEVLKKSHENSEIYSLIWTTTPWTLPANQAICFNSNLKYCLAKISESSGLYLLGVDTIENLQKELEKSIEIVEELEVANLGKLKYIHPINKDETLPFIHGDYVQSEKGTGLVHTAPSHGPDDFLVFLNRKTAIKSLVNEKGCYNQDAPEFLQNKEVLSEGNQLVLDYLNDNIVGLKKLKHSYPIDWRTKNPVIILASKQWFINTEKIKEKAIEELQKVEIFPRSTSQVNKNVLKVQLEKRPYWCISRQRAWGVPIPVFYEKSSGNPVINESVINRLDEWIELKGNVDFWWEESVEEILGKEILTELNLKADELEKGGDILDIWFDSGISWSSVLENEKVADLYLEGIDQFTGWFQSSLMTSVAIREIAPYKNIFVHGFAVDEKGHKMSKSLGNIISPNDIIKKFGVDTLRWWVAAHATQHTSIPVSFKLLEDSYNNLVKIRATLKYLLGIFNGKTLTETLDESRLNHLDKYILHNLDSFSHNSQNHYENYQFNRVVALVNNFVNSELSSVYLHLIKDRLYCNSDQDYQVLLSVLKPCYLTLCRVLWPITPFLVEESWSYLDEGVFYQTFLNAPINWSFEESFSTIQKALEIKRILSSSISEVNTWKLNVKIEVNDEVFNILKNLHPVINERNHDSELCEILQVQSVKLVTSDNDKIKVTHKITEKELCQRCRRFTTASGICERCQQVLKEKEVEPVKIPNK